MKPLIFITSNKNKAEQVSYHLNYPIEHIKIDLPEIQSLDLYEVVTYKVKEAYKQIKKPVLVEDVALTFNALGKLPGPLIKWFLHELKPEGLCRLLNKYKDRSAEASVVFGYYDGSHVALFEGSFTGSIAKRPKGDKSFGWNPIFIPDGYKKTWGEMNLDEQKDTSMRRIALKKLEKYLHAKD